MTEIENIVWANRDNLELLNQLRKAVGAKLARSPFERVEPPAATAEGAVYALLDRARVWAHSPRLVSLVIELEALARSFGPKARVRGLRYLSPETVAALLDAAPGGSVLARPVDLVGGKALDVGEPEASVALLTERPPEDGRLLNRLHADRSPIVPMAGVAITVLPVADHARLWALFAAPDALGRGDLAALKRDLDEVDRARVAAGAARAAVNLKLAFRMEDNQLDHQRGRTVATNLAPAPLAQLALDIVELVLPRDVPQIFLGKPVAAGRRKAAGPRYADHVRDVFTEILDTARAIAGQTAGLQELDLFCGISVIRRVSDLVAQETAMRREGLIDADEDDFDRPEAAARRLIESTMQARDTVLLLRAYEATILAYTDAVLAKEPADELRAACDVIVHDLVGGLSRRYRLARADLDDGVAHWTDVKPRATGSAEPRRWLPPSVVAAQVALSEGVFAPLLARPTSLSVLDDLVVDIAAEIDDVAEHQAGPGPANDAEPRLPLPGSTLREAWAALTMAYPPEDFFRKTVSGRP